MKSRFNTMLDYFESIAHTLDDSKRPQHDTQIDPPGSDDRHSDGWTTESLRFLSYLRRRSEEVFGPGVKNIPAEEKQRFIEQVKKEFLAERKDSVSKPTVESGNTSSNNS